MENKIVSKKNGNIDIIARTSKLESHIRNIKQLCWDCINSYPSICDKVYDIKKQNIEDYGFITDGYQIYNKDGELIYFAVERCDNFEKGVTRKRKK